MNSSASASEPREPDYGARPRRQWPSLRGRARTAGPVSARPRLNRTTNEMPQLDEADEHIHRVTDRDFVSHDPRPAPGFSQPLSASARAPAAAATGKVGDSRRRPRARVPRCAATSRARRPADRDADRIALISSLSSATKRGCAAGARHWELPSQPGPMFGVDAGAAEAQAENRIRRR